MKASLQIKNSTYQVVISYKDENGKHKTKWVSTGLKEGTGKRRLEERRREILSAFEEEYNRKLLLFPKTSLLLSQNIGLLNLWICGSKQSNRPLPIPRTSVTQKTFAKSRRILTITLCWTNLNPYTFKDFTTKCTLTVYQEIL